MGRRYVVGLDFGTASARGTLVDIETNCQEASCEHSYRHGVLTKRLPTGEMLPPNFALQVPADYTESAQVILSNLGCGRDVAGIGIDFTASSPLPARLDGAALAERHAREKHAYVKLWKHAAAQPFANAINARGGDFLEDFGGRISGEWLIPKAAEMRAEAADLWNETDRFIEAGDWLVWQLTGVEMRSLDFACYKAQFSFERGYPTEVVQGLSSRLSAPHSVGTTAGRLSDSWRRRTGIEGNAYVSVAAIDSHAVLPAVGAVEPGIFLGSLGTSAGYLMLDRHTRRLPKGLEGAAYGAVLPDLWCCEAGQAAFGDTLDWFVRTFPKSTNLSENFEIYNASAARLLPGESGLIALDWFGGNRVPLADSMLSGLLVGLNARATAEGIYRALVEALSFGARSTVELALAGGISINKIVLTSRLARCSFLIQTMSDVMGRPIEVPDIANPTALGAAIHGAVGAGVVADFAEGAERFGARARIHFQPDLTAHTIYERLYPEYRRLATDEQLQVAMHALCSAVSNSASAPPVER